METQPAGMIIESDGANLIIQVTSDQVEVGSILRAVDAYGIVTAMRYKEDATIGSRHLLQADLQIFGRLIDGRIRKIKRPLEPYLHVYFAGKQELETLLSGEDRIAIGVIYGTKARALLKASEFDRHIAILASTGSGKSYTAANLIKEYARLKLPVLIVDTHGEYPSLIEPLSKENKFQVEVLTVKHARSGMKQFKIPVSDLEPSDFHHFIPSLTDPQQNALEAVIEDVRKNKEHYLIDDLAEACSRLPVATTKGGTAGIGTYHEGTVGALQRKLKSLSRNFKDVFSTHGTDITTLIEPGQVTIIDVSLSQTAVRQAVVSYLAKELLKGRMNAVHEMEGDRIENPLMLLIEEAHNYAANNLNASCKHQLSRLASEGRKFGIGLVVVSQKPSKIDEEILSQCNTGIYMHITNPNDKEHIRKSFECINDTIIRDLDSLDVAECIIAGALVDVPFLLCKIDSIDVPKHKKHKFEFKTKKKQNTAGFDYA
ncbi:DNA double-strand break repair helicase HerA [uncultured archaeon]|nr:DNA double-strand break repair helicase HerA [uncultured archaeon]